MLEVLGVIISIIIVMLLVRKGLPMGWSLIIASFCVAILAGMNFYKIGDVVAYSLTSKETINLVLTVFFIGMMGELLKRTGSMEEMVENLNALIRDNRILLSLIPSLIGLLPVPGGAVLSAPMVEEAGDKLELSPSRLSSVNMFFRHIWFLVFPLFPAVILYLELSGVSFGRFFMLHFPVMLVTLLISFFWLFRGARVVSEKKPFETRVFLKFLQSILPIIVAVILAIGFGFYIPLALFIGVLIAFVNYVSRNKGNLWSQVSERLSYLKSGVKGNMILAIVGIMLYKDVIEASGVIDIIASFLVDMGIPLAVMVFIVPFVAGFCTGHNLASIGIAYPIFGPMFPEGGEFYALFLLLYVSSLTGYFISPIHLCLVLTREYFRESFQRIYYELTVPVVSMLLVTFITSFLWTLT